MSTSSPYVPPAYLPEETHLVSVFRVIVFYLGFGMFPAVPCVIVSPFAGGDAGVMVILPMLPLAFHLATWLCFRLRWRETPWFIGLFIAVPACYLAIIVCIVVLDTILSPGERVTSAEAWFGRILLGAGVAVAIELAVSNQLRQRSSMRDALIAAATGAFSIASLAIASPVLDPVLWFLSPVSRFPLPYESGSVTASYITWIFSIMLSTGLAIHRRARRESNQTVNADGLSFLRESNEPTP